MKLVIGADLVPTSSNIDLFNNRDMEALLGRELMYILNSADFRVFNLETPLADEKTPIEKNGPNLCAPVSATAGIKELGVNLLTLANNHIMDQGTAGFSSTLNALRAYGIDYAGAGNYLEEAAVPYIADAKKF